MLKFLPFFSLSLSHVLIVNLATSICSNILWIIKEALEDILCALRVFLMLFMVFVR
jgi:hypothetical protein